MAPATKTKPSAKQLRNEAMGLGIKGWEDMDRKQLRKAIKRAKRKAEGSEETAPTKPAKAAPKEKAKTVTTKARPKTKAAAAKTKPKTTTTKPKAAKTKPKATKAPAKKAAPAKASKATARASNGNVIEDGDFTFVKTHPKDTPAPGENPFRKAANLHRVAKLVLKGGVRRTLAEKLKGQVDLHPYQKKSKDVTLLDYDKRILLCAQTMRDQYGYGIQRVGRGLDGKILVFIPGAPNDPRKKVAKKTAKK